MPSLASIGERFKETFTTDAGLPFRATINPTQDGKIYDDDYFVVRQIIRISPDVPVVAGTVVFDPLQRPFLLGNLDQTAHYVGFRAYPCSHRATWQREQTITDPLTGLAKGTALATIDTPWVLSELLDKEGRSGSFKVREDMHRILTGRPVELNDVIDGFTVKRINIANGIRVLEVV